MPAARHCPVFPANNAWNERVDKLPVASDSAQLIASIGLDAPVHADFGSGKWDGGPIGIPFDVVSKQTQLSHVSFAVRRRVQPRPLPDPATRPDRGRRACDGRPARDPGGQELVSALRAVRPAPHEPRLDGRVRRDLESPLEPPPAGGMDVGRRRRATDLPRPRPLGRGQARRDRPRAALHRAARRGAHTSIPRATTPPTRATHRCRRWGCGSGSRPA